MSDDFLKAMPDHLRDKPTLTYKEVMECTGLGKTKVYDLFRQGKLGGFKEGGSVRFYTHSLVAHITRQENHPQGAPPPASPPRRPPPPPPLQGRYHFFPPSDGG